jgi:hypothetical protein
MCPFEAYFAVSAIIASRWKNVYLVKNYFP